MPYDPRIQGNQILRVIAKLIDILPYLVIMYFVELNLWIKIFISTILLIIQNTFLETIYGKTIGKQIFKIRVIDDKASNPDFILSLNRNILSILNLIPIYIFGDSNNPYKNEGFRFYMNLNNNICKTHIIKESKLIEIKKIQKK
ncbi:RDD family protein [Aquimarina spinulae]|uniref:RDD family protein n=1 Tax=Aquimarina spinulae TaxID=1192023 RepID=UPI000D54D58A